MFSFEWGFAALMAMVQDMAGGGKGSNAIFGRALRAEDVMRKLTVLVTIIALFIGCSKQQGIEAETQNRLNMQVSQSKDEYQENLDICEAVFRYQFKHNASAVQQDAKAYFITIFKKDPSDKFLARFSGNTPPVRKGSDFAIGKGLVFSISSIDRIDENTVQVFGGYYETRLSSSGNIYTVVRKNGKWVVEEDEMLWISSISQQTFWALFPNGDPPHYVTNRASH